MSNECRMPASRWWLVLLLVGLACLVCAVPVGALFAPFLILSEIGSRGCGIGQSSASLPSAPDTAPSMALDRMLGGTLAGPTPTATLPGGCGIDPHGNAIVAWALAIAAALYACPDSFDPGQPPPYMDACYDQHMPTRVIQYWEQTCPGCREWQNGNLQCVMSVLASFGLGGAPAPVAGNAISFWLNYAHLPGWVEIPSFFEPGSTSTLAAPGVRGIPQPGDMVVWYISWDPFVGHIAVVVKVKLPAGGHLGGLIFAEANGPTPLYTMTINPDLTVNAWPGYYVAGYVRSLGATNTT